MDFFLINKDGKEIKIFIDNLRDFSLLIEHPVIMDVFKRNLKLTVGSLLLRNKPSTLHEFENGILAIQNYLQTNPGFLSYRFGIDQSLKMVDGVNNFVIFMAENKINSEKILIRFKKVED